ncbi:hypothetical protein LBMAG56_20380 [Verrucomicrobiota bacterium]|nr:hypothetical protein LBMAG56_20380 [Verrucomicrobiota bacterium]
MNDPEKYGNLLEAGLWFAVSLILLAKLTRATGRLRRVFAILAAAFFVFGITDLIESQTGAWWRPWWLLVLKATCVATFVFGFREYYRIKGNRDGTPITFGEAAGHIRVADPGANSPLDFAKGDSLTLEAWVSPTELKSGQMVYVISKGRTGSKGAAVLNQNYALRLSEQAGEARLAFLFRDSETPKPTDAADAHWHRWTSEAGFAPGSGWHHLAVTYTFGKGDSLRGYIDGEVVAGVWDMGGKSDAGPVVDDDDLWIGSAMGGKLDATFHGQINEVAIHRRALAAADIRKRFKFIAPAAPVLSRDLPPGEVRVEIVENIGSNNSWNFAAPAPVETYTVPAFGFAELPLKYSEKGLRTDRSAPFLLRASALVKLGQGEHKLLLRALQSARLTLDGKVLASTKFIIGGGDGHGAVPEVPKNLPEGLRFARLAHDEVTVTVKSDGREHLVVLEAFIGGKGLRPEVGELSVTLQDKDATFWLLSPKEKVPHTDEGWTAYTGQQRALLTARNAARRREVAAAETKHWAARHEFARKLVAAMPAPAAPAVAATTPVQNEIDRFIGARLETTKATPAPLTDDYAFLRRVTLDTIGLLPTPQQIQEFMADTSGKRRANAIERLLRHPGWADHWVSYWQDVLAENPGILKPTLNNTGPFRWWIHEAFADNRPVDQFATELVTMSGSVYGGGPAGFGLATQNDAPMADRAQVVSQAFLAMNLACSRCHDAPYHDFKQKDLFSLAAMLNQAPQEVPKSSSIPANANIKVGRVVQVTLKPGEKVDPAWPFAKGTTPTPLPDSAARGAKDHREQLAAAITDPQNPRFARVIVNRLWKRYLGLALIEPVDDWEFAKPSHPELLDWLARELVTHDYDLQHVARLIFNSHTYQRVAGLNPPATDKPEDRLFASPLRRRMSAEQLVDSLFAAVGKEFNTEPLTLDNDNRRAAKDFLNLGAPRRAWEFVGFANDRDRPALALPKAQAIADVLGMFGRRESRQGPLNARDESPNVLQPAALANGDLANARATRLSEDCGLTDLCVKSQPLPALIDQVFLRVLSRPPTASERELLVQSLEVGYADRVVAGAVAKRKKEYDPTLLLSWTNHLNPKATDLKMAAEERARQGDEPTPRLQPHWRERMEDVLWALVNSPEFVFVP